MDGQKKEKQPQKANIKIETFVLVVYTFYSLGLFSSSLHRDFHPYAQAGIVFMVVVNWMFKLLQIKNLLFRAGCVSVSGMTCFLLYECGTDIGLVPLLPYVCTFVVLIGLYGKKELLGVSFLFFTLLFIGELVLRDNINSLGLSEMMHFLIQFLNGIMLNYLVCFWVRKRTESGAETQTYIQELREAEDSKDDFLANISHEIRTPINTICGISEILLQKEMPAEIRNEIFYIQTAGRNLTSVVSDILDFSELQTGKIELAKEEYNITSTINDVINMSLAKISEKKIELIVDCDATLPSCLLGDEKKIRRVIMNMMDNAIKFTEEGCVSLSVEYRKEEYGVNLIITIKDTGIGMEQRNLEKLFNGFSQVDSRRNRKNGGVGLGLAISQIMVQKMGGIISIKSKYQQGTTVKIVIPQPVISASPITQLENVDTLNLGLYLDLEEYKIPQVRDGYLLNIEHMAKQMQVKSHICRNLAELKRRHGYDKFSHVFISLSEYFSEQVYFDELSKETYVVVILHHEEEYMITNPRLLKLFKPFYVLPIANVLKGSLRGEHSENYGMKRKKLTTRDVHVLVVDDNLMNIKVVEGILQKYKISVATANSGKAALRVVEKKGFDLVFMDHMMPEMDGVEAMHEIRKLPGSYFNKLPIVALTANAIAGAREMFLKEGFDDFIEKPVERSVLERLLIRNLPEDKIILEEEQEEITEAASEQQNFGKAKEASEPEAIKEEKQLEATENVAETEATEAKSSPEQGLVIGDLDIQTGIAYCGGEESYISILTVCGDTAEDNMNQLKNFFETQNWKEYTILIHGVKSSMKTVGAMKLSEMAKDLEMAGKSGDTAYIEANHEAMLTEYERVNAFLHESPLLYDQTVKEEEGPTKEYDSIEEDAFLEKLQELENAMYDFDGDAMTGILTELQGYAYLGNPLDKPLDGILRKVQMSDLMSAVDALTKVKQDMDKKSN